MGTDVYISAMDKREIHPLPRNYPTRNPLEREFLNPFYKVYVGDYHKAKSSWEVKEIRANRAVGDIMGYAPSLCIGHDKYFFPDPHTGLIMAESGKWAWDPEDKMFIMHQERFAHIEDYCDWRYPKIVADRRTKELDYWLENEEFDGFFMLGLNWRPDVIAPLYLDLAYPEWRKEYRPLIENYRTEDRRFFPYMPPGETIIFLTNYILPEDLERAYDELNRGNVNVTKFVKKMLWGAYDYQKDEDNQRLLNDLHLSIHGGKATTFAYAHNELAAKSLLEEDIIKHNIRLFASWGIDLETHMTKELIQRLEYGREKRRADEGFLPRHEVWTTYDDVLLKQANTYPTPDQIAVGDWGAKTHVMYNYLKDKSEKEEAERVRKMEEEAIQRGLTKGLQMAEEQKEEHIKKYTRQMEEEFKNFVVDNYTPKLAKSLKEQVVNEIFKIVPDLKIIQKEKIMKLVGLTNPDAPPSDNFFEYLEWRDKREEALKREQEREDLKYDMKVIDFRFPERIAECFLRFTKEKKLELALYEVIIEADELLREETETSDLETFKYFKKKANKFRKDEDFPQKRVEIKYPANACDRICKKWGNPSLNTLFNVLMLRRVLKNMQEEEI